MSCLCCGKKKKTRAGPTSRQISENVDDRETRELAAKAQAEKLRQDKEAADKKKAEEAEKARELAEQKEAQQRQAYERELQNMKLSFETQKEAIEHEMQMLQEKQTSMNTAHDATRHELEENTAALDQATILRDTEIQELIKEAERVRQNIADAEAEVEANIQAKKQAQKDQTAYKHEAREMTKYHQERIVELESRIASLRREIQRVSNMDICSGIANAIKT